VESIEKYKKNNSNLVILFCGFQRVVNHVLENSLGNSLATPKSQARPKVASASRTRKFEDLKVCSQHLALKGVEGHAEAPRLD